MATKATTTRENKKAKTAAVKNEATAKRTRTTKVSESAKKVREEAQRKPLSLLAMHAAQNAAQRQKENPTQKEYYFLLCIDTKGDNSILTTYGSKTIEYARRIANQHHRNHHWRANQDKQPDYTNYQIIKWESEIRKTTIIESRSK